LAFNFVTGTLFVQVVAGKGEARLTEDGEYFGN